MEIRENATYPYPIWGLHDDFMGPEPEATFEMRLDKNTNEFVLDYTITTTNEGIERLIAEHKATYKCIVECITTYYLQMQEQSTPVFQVRIPAEKVHKNITVKMLVIATQEIVGCDYLDVNEIYEGVVDYPKGGAIAFIDKILFDLQQRDNDTDLSKIFRTLAADVQKVEYSIAGEHIVIKYPKESKNNLISVEGICPAIIEAAFVFPAFVYALFQLDEHKASNNDWVVYLKNMVDDFYGGEEREDYKLEVQEVYDIANTYFPGVHTSMLSQAKNIIDQMDTALGDN